MWRRVTAPDASRDEAKLVCRCGSWFVEERAVREPPLRVVNPFLLHERADGHTPLRLLSSFSRG